MRAGLAVATICLLLGATSALELRHVSGAHGLPLTWSMLLASTMPRWLLLAAALPFVLQLAVRYPIVPLRLPYVALHVALLVALSLSHAMLDTWGTGHTSPVVRHLFGIIPRLARSWYNTLPTLVTMYGGVLMAAWGMTEAHERQRRTLRAAQLESQLQAARLTALRAQLQPHFLHNTLNGIAALVAALQPERAVAAIEQLGELLHASLREDGRETITISEEVDLAERYVELQRMRFGERLACEWCVDDALRPCLVPVLLLQPIVENAVVHGLEAGVERLMVRIAVAPVREGIEITVENDGPGLSSARGHVGGHGLGLAATRARLTTAYGDRASLTLEARPEGGVRVRIVVPRVEAAIGTGPMREPAVGATA